MTHTVVGIFNDHTQTQRAVEQLEAMGVASRNIDVAKNQGSGKEVKDEPGETKEWVGTSNINDNNLTRFFKSLFSDRGDDTPDRFSRVVSSGHAVVTVLAASHEEAVRVADILDECGAINVDEHSDNASQSTYRSTAAAPIQNTSHDQATLGPETNESARADRMRSQIINRTIEDDVRLRSSNQLGRTDTDSNRAGTSGF